MEGQSNQKNHSQKSKQKVFWDIDDVILNSLETAIDIINKKFNIPNNLPVKTIKDVKDWELKSINKTFTKDQLFEIYESDEFWSNVNFNKQLNSSLVPQCFDNYSYTLITKGTPKNIEQKKNFLSKKLSNLYHLFDFVSVGVYESKGKFDMTGAIQIDDNLQNLLDTNAAIKILVTNGMETDYNNAFGAYREPQDNLYIVHDLNDVAEILKFNAKHNLLTI